MNDKATSTRPAPTRSKRSYSLEGLPARDALVFKSMMRLLRHRTNDAWVYVASSTELHVVADGLPVSALESSAAQQVLKLGAINIKRQSYLCLPLHAKELVAELNRLGALIASTGKSVAPALAAHAATPMRMLRWPPASLLTTTARVRLATLMASKPLTVVELQQRSKESLAVCSAFFKDLKQLNLLIPVMTSLPATVTSPHGAAATHQPQPDKRPIQRSLLERIRMRLSLQMTRASGQASRS